MNRNGQHRGLRGSFKAFYDFVLEHRVFISLLTPIVFGLIGACAYIYKEYSEKSDFDELKTELSELRTTINPPPIETSVKSPTGLSQISELGKKSGRIESPKEAELTTATAASRLKVVKKQFPLFSGAILVELEDCQFNKGSLVCRLNFQSFRDRHYDLEFVLGLKLYANYEPLLDYPNLEFIQSFETGLKNAISYDFKIDNQDRPNALFMLAPHSELTISLGFNDIPVHVRKLNNLSMFIDGVRFDFEDVIIRNSL